MSSRLTIFLGAFLLFQVQPMLGKFLLPWFGGGPGVWSACLVFFQVLLLGGYAYAHGLARWLTPRRQAGVHVMLLAASFAWLPITPHLPSGPAVTDAPGLRILALLAGSIGMPYLLLSSTSPLLQSWLARGVAGASPYRLYAVSNAGSLLGLLAYPFVVEPLLGLRAQTLVWSVCYGLFVLSAGWCALSLYRSAPTERGTAENDLPGGRPADAARLADRLLWVALAACGSVLLLATTNILTQDVAPVPFLWVVPLAAYLLSFIVCFDRPRWYQRRLWVPAMCASLAALAVVVLRELEPHLWAQVAGLSGTLFVCCMVCHGELVRLKPEAQHLTSFYLRVALGGAVGGAFVSLVAPVVFTNFWEFPLGLLAAYVLFALCLCRDKLGEYDRRSAAWAWGAFALGLAALLVVLLRVAALERANTLASARNFYGALCVQEVDKDTAQWRRYLCHGWVRHGAQLMAAERRGQPLAYYGRESGLGLAIRHHPRRHGQSGERRALRLGVVGLGVGTTAALAEAGEVVRFYEINPQVVEFSTKYFTYRQDSPARQEIILGDARLAMERELAESGPQQYDVLALDAFSSDAIPVHLLTREAFALYARHLQPEGILAVHVSNRHLDLAPVVRGLAQRMGMEAAQFVQKENEDDLLWSNRWILVTRNQPFLRNPAVSDRREPWDDADREPLVWTDDHSNLARILK